MRRVECTREKNARRPASPVFKWIHFETEKLPMGGVEITICNESGNARGDDIKAFLVFGYLLARPVSGPEGHIVWKDVGVRGRQSRRWEGSEHVLA